MMIRIIVENTALDLPADMKMRVEFNNSLENMDVIAGSKVYWFDLPSSPVNLKVLNHASFIKIGERLRQYDASLYFDSYKFPKGKLTIGSVTEDNIRACYIMQLVSSDFKEKMLTDFDFGDDVDLGDDQDEIIEYANTNVESSYPDVDFTFPVIYSPDHYGDIEEEDEEEMVNPDYEGFLNNYDRGEGTFIKNVVSESNPVNLNTLVPMVFLMKVWKTIFDELGILVKGEFITDEEINRIILFCNKSIDFVKQLYYTFAGRITTNQIVNGGSETVIFNSDNTSNYQDVDNAYNTTTGEYTVQAEGLHRVEININIESVVQGDRQYARVHVPFNNIDVYVAFDNETSGIENIVASYERYCNTSDIGKKFKIVIEFYFEVDAYPGDEYEGSGTIYTGSWMKVTNISQNELNRHKSSFNLADQLPKMKAVDFIAAIRNTFGLACYIDSENKEIEFEFLRSIVTSRKVLDVTGYAEPQYEIELKESAGFLFDFKWNSADKYLENNFKDYSEYNYGGTVAAGLPTGMLSNYYYRVLNLNKIYIHNSIERRRSYFTDDFLQKITGNGGVSIIPDLSVLTMQNALYEAYFLCPRILAPGSSVAFAVGPNDNPLQLLFYRGMQDAADSDPYPFATAMVYNYAGTKIGTYNLKWDQADGLYEVFWEDWCSFFDTAETVRRRIHPDIKDMNELISLFLPGGYRKYAVESVHYIPLQLNIILTMKGIEDAEIIGLKKAD